MTVKGRTVAAMIAKRKFQKGSQYETAVEELTTAKGEADPAKVTAAEQKADFNLRGLFS